MRQNIASLVIDAETLKAIDGTLATLEKQLEDFIELSAEQRRELLKLGPKSEVFCRETISVMERSPGALPADGFLLENLAELIDTTRRHLAPRLPLILMGHSLGGLLAARLVSLNLRTVDALVLSSPALDAGMNAFQKLLVAVLPRLAPDLRVGNGLDARYLSHDAGVVQAYRDDPLVHDRISARLARFIAEAGPAVLASAPHWRVPTLLLYAGDDRLVNPDGSRRFAAAAPANVVSAHRFDRLYHEIFNEVERETVFAQLKTWLDARF